MYRQAVLFGQLIHGGAFPVLLCDFPVSLFKCLPAAGCFSPLPVMRRIRRDIDLSALDVALQLPDQLIGKKRLCVDVFHAGSLLEIIFRRQSQH